MTRTAHVPTTRRPTPANDFYRGLAIALYVCLPCELLVAAAWLWGTR